MTQLDPDIVEKAREGHPVAMTRVLVSIPSVNPELETGGSGEEEVARMCAGWLEAWGYAVRLEEVAPARYNVVASAGDTSKRALVLNGHLDTVGIAGMTVAPFGGDSTESRIVGRGACDMKGGVGALLAAAARIAAKPPRAGGLFVALTADEEHASLGMEAFVASEPVATAAVVCEPTGLAVMPANKGFVWLELEFKGRAAHGSRPDVGIDAIRHAAQYLAGLDGYEVRLSQRAPHPLLGHPSFHAGTIEGGAAPSVYPAACRLVIERRTLPGEQPGRVEQEFAEMLDGVRRAFPDVDARLTRGLARPATEVPVDTELVRRLLAACSDVGLDRSIEGMSAWVDAALLNEASVPAVCFGPGSIVQAHSADEWVETSEIKTAAVVLERFSRSFLDGGGPS